MAGGGSQRAEFYTAADDGIVETVVGVNSIDRNVTDPVPRAVAPNDPPARTERPGIAEAFLRMNEQLYINPEGGALTAGSPQYERLWLEPRPRRLTGRRWFRQASPRRSTSTISASPGVRP